VPAPAPASQLTQSPAAPPNAERRALPLAQWLDIIQDQPDEHPHLIVYARSGAGKTTLVKAILAQRPGQVAYLSPKPGEFGDVTYPTIRVVDDEPSYDQIETGLRQVLRELGRRLTLGVAHQHEPLTIVLDDYATLKIKCPSAPKALFEVGTIGRSLRMRLVIVTTTKRVKGLGLDGLGDALDNFVELELPKETRFVSGFLTLDEREPLAIDLAGTHQLSQQPIATARWWVPPIVTTAETTLQPGNPEVAAVTAVATVTQPAVTPVEIAEISAKLTKGMSPSNVAKSLRGYDPRDYKTWAAKVAAVQELLKSLDTSTPSTGPLGETTEMRRAITS
jgi:hypothetical protein